VRLDYVEQRRSPLSAVDGEALGYAEYFAELIDEWAPEGDPGETLYRLGVSMVEAMAMGVPIQPLARYFEYWLLRLQGVYGDGAELSSGARAFLEAARGSSPFALSGVKVSHHVLRELEAAHRGLIALHLEKDLKSVRVLQEMRR
jgi:Recombination protein O C terminal